MVEFKLKKTVLRLDFSFFLAAALFLLTNSGFGLAALCACGIHEFSHLIMMIIFGIKADEILFYGAGIRISSKEINYAEKLPRALILAAGCAGNLAAAAVMLVIGNSVAAAINLFTALFNLLPIGALDGAQLLKNAAVSRCKPENVDKILRAAEIISAALLITFVLIFGGVSFSLAAVLIYIVMLSCIKA